ncbi:protein of unknown function [Burkholderia multivorans]
MARIRLPRTATAVEATYAGLRSWFETAPARRQEARRPPRSDARVGRDGATLRATPGDGRLTETTPSVTQHQEKVNPGSP